MTEDKPITTDIWEEIQKPLDEDHISGRPITTLDEAAEEVYHIICVGAGKSTLANGYQWVIDKIKKVITEWQSQQTKPTGFTTEQVKYLLEWQIRECAVFTQRCARDKGAASFEMDEWIKSTPIIDFETKGAEETKPVEDKDDEFNIELARQTAALAWTSATNPYRMYQTFSDYWNTLGKSEFIGKTLDL